MEKKEKKKKKKEKKRATRRKGEKRKGGPTFFCTCPYVDRANRTQPTDRSDFPGNGNL